MIFSSTIKKISLLFSALFLGLFFVYSISCAKTVTIFYTTDIHGVLNFDHGGIFKLSTVLKNQVYLAGGYNSCLLIDCGDFSQGSIESSLSYGEIDYQLLKLMNYNVLILGNHEFDYGFEALQKNILSLSGLPEVLCGNLMVNGKRSNLKEWDIFYRNGFKIAIIGLTYPNTKSSNSSNIKYETTDPYKALKRIVPEVIKSHPDIIILAIHGGIYNKGWSLKYLAKKFPEIDLILAGHTHIEEENELFNRTYVFQSGSHCEKLGKIEISDTPNSAKKIITTQLIPLADEKVDTELIEDIKPILTIVNKEKKKVIATSKTEINIKKLLPKAINDYAKTDVTILGLSTEDEINSKNITYSDVFKLIPHEDNIATLDVSKDELLKIVQELYRYDKKKKKYNGLFYYGFKIVKAKNGYPIEIAINPDILKNVNGGKLSVAISSYYIEYPTNKFPDIREIVENKTSNYKNLGVSIRNIFIDFLKQTYN